MSSTHKVNILNVTQSAKSIYQLGGIEDINIITIQETCSRQSVEGCVNLQASFSKNTNGYYLFRHS